MVPLASAQTISPTHQGRRVEMVVAHDLAGLENFLRNVQQLRQSYRKNPDRHFSFFHPQWGGVCYVLYAPGSKRSMYMVRFSENGVDIIHYDVRYTRGSFDREFIMGIIPDAKFKDISREEQDSATYHANQKPPLQGNFDDPRFLEVAVTDALDRVEQFTEAQRQALHL